METEADRKRIGEEIKKFLVVNGIDRGRFADITGLGKSTVDKLVTGVFSEKTLAKVLEKTSFKLKTLYASKLLGGYSKANWEGYIRRYVMLHPAPGGGAVSATLVSVAWDDRLPGLVLFEGHDRRIENMTPIGALWIPHERSPLIYIQPVDSIGVRMILSTMIGEPCMRGLVLMVENVVANAYIPVASPVTLKRLEADEAVSPDELGHIDFGHEKFDAYQRQLEIVLKRQFARLSDCGGVSAPNKA